MTKKGEINPEDDYGCSRRFRVRKPMNGYDGGELIKQSCMLFEVFFNVVPFKEDK